MKIKQIVSIFLLFFIVGCYANKYNKTENIQINTAILNVDTFDNYVKKTKKHIQNNRVFITNDANKELEANTPFKIKSKKPNSESKGILLVHGLGDSPFYFKELAEELSNNGFLVHVMLLPGHGTKASDLIYIKNKQWKKSVKLQVKLLEKEVDKVYLGGFSTGANLVTSYAIENKNIKGLLLFSPAFKSNFLTLALAPYAKYVKTWADKDPNNNYVHYESLAMNAASLYYETTKDVQELLEKNVLKIPIFISLSQNDSVIDKNYILETFKNKFTNKKSILMWYGDNKAINDSRIIVLKKKIEDENISNISHMSALFSKNNLHYGKNGTYKMINNGQDLLYKDFKEKKEDIWYSAYGYKEENKYHARLTWNPYFAEMINSIIKITNNN